VKQFEQTPRRVLVVDDDKNLRKIIATNLELGGFDVVTAWAVVEHLHDLRNRSRTSISQKQSSALRNHCHLREATMRIQRNEMLT